MKPSAALANGAWLAASLPAWRRFRRALQTPAEVQMQILRRVLSTNSGTAYGEKHGFQRIENYAQFRDHVPVVEYHDLEPWMARLRQGEQGVFTKEKVTRFVPTSGSTAGCKLIPFTAGLQREWNAAIGPWMVDLSRNHPAVPFGPAYWSISPAMPARVEVTSAVPIGFDDDSAYLGGMTQRLAEATFAAPSALRHVAEIECFRYVTLLSLLREPELRLVSVWHPSFLALLLEALPQSWEELLGDVERGGCRRAESLPENVREAMAAAPHKRRAEELRGIDPAQPGAIWARLAVVSCWGDGQAALPLAALRRRLPHAAFQAKGLLATEAFVSIPFEGLHPVAVTSHFFEFESQSGEVLLASELCPGETYAVIVTTAGGLYRYRLGDLVEMDGTVGATPSLRFLGRGGRTSDLCGEKLAETFVTQAIAAACAASGCAPDFAMLAPTADPAGRWSYTLYVEGEVTHEFLPKLEAELRRNPHYALCRDLGQLAALGCFQVTRGAYEIFCEVSSTEGRRVGDVKPQSLSMRTDWTQRFAAIFDGP